MNTQNNIFPELRMSESGLNFLLEKACNEIQGTDKILRETIPAEIQLQVVLYFLGTGCSSRTLTHLFLVGKATIRKYRYCFDTFHFLFSSSVIGTALFICFYRGCPQIPMF